MTELVTPQKVLRNKHLANVQEVGTPFKIPASPLMKTLGYGTGVSVYKFVRSPIAGQIRSPWAIKKVSKRFIHQKTYETRLLDEAEILRKLNHPNIVGFRGMKKTTNGASSLVLECCEKSLGDILENRREDELDTLPYMKIQKVNFDILKALDYLHTKAKLLHADLKSYNILIKGDFDICKLCDFGVSLPLNDEGNVDYKAKPESKFIGTEAWLAPEVLDKCDLIDAKADIFSYGLVIYEMLTMIPPHTINILNNNSYEDDDDCTFEENSMSEEFGTRPSFPEEFDLDEEYNAVLEIFYVCTENEPDDRPTASELVSVLNDLFK